MFYNSGTNLGFTELLLLTDPPKIVRFLAHHVYTGYIDYVFPSSTSHHRILSFCLLHSQFLDFYCFLTI